MPASSRAGIDPVTHDAEARIVLAADTDEQVNAVVARMVRRLAPAPSDRGGDLPSGRTIPDLPPLALLPLGTVPGLVERFGLPVRPGEVARAAVEGTVFRTDVPRHDGGGGCLDGGRRGGGDRASRGVGTRGGVGVAGGRQDVAAGA